MEMSDVESTTAAEHKGTKRLIAEIESQPAQREKIRRQLDECEQAFIVSPDELIEWIGSDKNPLKKHAALLSRDISVQSIMPVVKRQFDIEFDIASDNPKSRYLYMSEFDAYPSPADHVTGTVDRSPDFYQPEVIVNGYRVLRGWSNSPPPHQASLSFNVHSMVAAEINALRDQESFLRTNVELRPYAELQEIPSDNVMAFLERDKECEGFKPSLIPKVGTPHYHPTAKVMAVANPENVDNGVWFTQLPSPVNGELVPVAVMHVEHLVSEFLVINAMDDPVWIRALNRTGSKKNRKREILPGERCYMVMPEPLYRRYAQLVCERFVNRAPLIDPRKMVFKLNVLHRPHEFDKVFFSPEIQPVQHFQARWTLELEYTLVPRRVGNRAILCPDMFPGVRAMNGQMVEAMLRKRDAREKREASRVKLEESMKDYMRD